MVQNSDVAKTDDQAVVTVSPIHSASSKRIVVLGGLGFIGQHLTRALAKHGHDVVAFGKPGQRFISAPPSVKIEHGDFANRADLDRVLAGANVAFHLVSGTLPHTSAQNPALEVRANILPSLALIDSCLAANVEQLVFLSSGGTVYGQPTVLPISEEHRTDPISPYGVAKLTIEKFIQLACASGDLKATIARLSNPFGTGQAVAKRQGIIAAFAHAIAMGKPVEVWGDGTVVRDYIAIEDTVEALLRCVGQIDPVRLYNVGSGTGRSIIDLLDAFRRIEGREIDVNFLPGRPVDVKANVLDIRKIERELGWTCAATFDTSIRELLEYYRAARPRE